MEQLEISLLAPSPPCKGYYNPLPLPAWDATPTFIVLNGMSIHREVRVVPFSFHFYLQPPPPLSPRMARIIVGTLWGKESRGSIFWPTLKKQVLKILAARLKKKSKPLEQNLAILCGARDKKWNVPYQVETAKGREIAWEKNISCLIRKKIEKLVQGTN